MVWVLTAVSQGAIKFRCKKQIVLDAPTAEEAKAQAEKLHIEIESVEFGGERLRGLVTRDLSKNFARC